VKVAARGFAVDYAAVRFQFEAMQMRSSLRQTTPDVEFDPKLSLADFVVGDSDDPIVPPLAFTQWRQAGAWEATLYEPELLATADARTTINYEGRPCDVINLCSYNYLGLANRP